MTFSVEPGAEKLTDPCDCCGERTRHVQGYVYRNGDARAVYYAVWTNGHLERGISLSIGLGDWGQGFGPKNRFAFCLEYRHGKSGGFRVEDATRFVREEAIVLGQPMDRHEAAGHPLEKELFAICDVLLTDDPRIREFLAGT